MANYRYSHNSRIPITTNSTGSDAIPPINTVPRVLQLDAHRIDVELFNLFSQQLKQCFKYMPQIYERFKPELMSLLESFIFFYSIWKSQQTYGQHLVGLHLVFSQTGSSSRRSKILWFLFVLVSKYLVKRLSVNSSLFDWGGYSLPNWRKILWVLILWLENSVKLLSLWNLLLFLANGTYPTIIQRILSIPSQVSPSQQHRLFNRRINFEYMNRSLFIQSLRSLNEIALPFSLASLFSSLLSKSLTPESFSLERRALYKHVPKDSCPICLYHPTTNGILTSCGCRFCHVCLVSQFPKITSFSELVPETLSSSVGVGVGVAGGKDNTPLSDSDFDTVNPGQWKWNSKGIGINVDIRSIPSILTRILSGLWGKVTFSNLQYLDCPRCQKKTFVIPK